MNDKEKIERALNLADRFIKVLERWADREYPVDYEIKEATFSKVGDIPVPQSVEEYHAFEAEAEPRGRRKPNA